MRSLLAATLLILWMPLISCQNTDGKSYYSCWKIDTNPLCNDPYNTDNLGCYWDEFDSLCMCRIADNILNIIYLVDISLAAAPLQSDVDKIFALIQELNDSTLQISPSMTVFNQIILYDDNQKVLSPNTATETLNMDKYERSELNDITNAIFAAMQRFDELDTKHRVLVIFNGETQNNYNDDATTVCSLKYDLNFEEITVIMVSYVNNEGDKSRNLECLLSNNAYYNQMPLDWSKFPLKAKLSSDLCDITYEHPSMSPTPEPTPKPSTPTTAAPSLTPTPEPTPRPTVPFISQPIINTPQPTPNHPTMEATKEEPIKTPTLEPTQRPTLKVLTTAAVEHVTSISVAESTSYDTTAIKYQPIKTSDLIIISTNAISDLSQTTTRSAVQTMDGMSTSTNNEPIKTSQRIISTLKPTLEPTPRPTFGAQPTPEITRLVESTAIKTANPTTQNPAMEMTKDDEEQSTDSTLSPTAKPTLEPTQRPTNAPNTKVDSITTTEYPSFDSVESSKYPTIWVKNTRKPTRNPLHLMSGKWVLDDDSSDSSSSR